ncbi:MAG: T9SS type A sorting domain-containing protein, partial [Flavobacteriaceae bacterium]|nr:T9SS type A sorting domain-containing protein [Flavobacteriaceae bacterium]
NHDFNYEFRGRANNGAFTIPVGNNLMTLAGNPYPSSLDLALVVNNNSSVSTIWFYDEDRAINSHYYTANRAGYGTWVPAGGTNGTYNAPTFVEWDSSGGGGGGGSTGTGSNYNRRYAPIGQGFMLIGNTNGTANIDNSMRVYQIEGTNSDFRNNDESNSGDSNPDDLWPQFKVITEFGESHSRILTMLFSDESTNGYDHGMDGYHPMDADNGEAFFPIYYNEGNVVGEYDPYSIQTIPYQKNTKIPLAFQLNEQTVINVLARDFISFNRPAYLWDSVENTYALISGEDNQAFLTLPEGIYDDRFYIVFNSSVEVLRDSEGTLAQEEVRENMDFYQNNRVKQLEISNPEGYNIKHASVFDMSGKLVINKSNVGSDFNIAISTAMLSDGVYLIRLTTDDYIDIDYKMIIENK